MKTPVNTGVYGVFEVELGGRTVKERGMKSLGHEQLGFVMASFSKMRIVVMCIWFWVI